MAHQWTTQSKRSWCRSGADVLDEQHEGEVINGGGLETVVTVEVGGLCILCMDEYEPESGDVGYFSSLEEEVFEECCRQATFLVLKVNGEATQQHGWQRIGLMAGCTTRRAAAGQYRGTRFVEGDHAIITNHHSGAAGSLALVATSSLP